MTSQRSRPECEIVQELNGRMKRRRFLTGGVWVLGSSLLPLARATAATDAPRWFSSVVWAVFENHGYDEIMRSLPRLSAHRNLVAEGRLLTHYYAVAHPSGPNYRAMVSGKTWGKAEQVRDTIPDAAPPPTVGTVLYDVAPVFTYHLAGRIAQRHDPFLDLKTPAHVGNGDDFERDLANNRLPPHCLVYLGWDDDNDMHSGPIERGDENLTDLKRVLGTSKWFNTADEHGLFPWLFICYDEDGKEFGRGDEHNHVFACWWRPWPYISPTSIDTCFTHYSFCYTVTANWGRRPLERATTDPPGMCPSTAMSEVFG